MLSENALFIEKSDDSYTADLLFNGANPDHNIMIVTFY